MLETTERNITTGMCGRLLVSVYTHVYTLCTAERRNIAHTQEYKKKKTDVMQTTAAFLGDHGSGI